MNLANSTSLQVPACLLARALSVSACDLASTLAVGREIDQQVSDRVT
jgi:hypothetical protein